MQETLHPSRVKLLTKPIELVGPYNPSLLATLLPKSSTLQRLAISLMFVGLLVGSSRVSFHLPDNPVPITLQTGTVLLTGGILGFRWGMFSVLTWYFMGMVGIPVFASGANGWAFLSGGATAGYIIGFIGAAGLVGFLSQRGWTRSKSLWPMLLGNLLIYVPGLIWLALFTGLTKENVLSKGMYPFIPGDLVKLMAGSIVVGGLWNFADRNNKKKA